MSSSENPDRNWLAMQYVLGELPEHEQVAFEERLPTDLDLCEAVTAASLVLQTTRAAFTTPDTVARSVVTSPQPATKSNRSLLAVAVASAAMALAVLLVVRLPQNTQQPAVLTANPNPQAAELVSLWQSGSDPDNEDADDVDDELESGAEVAVPSWMLAAVSIEAQGSAHTPSDKAQEN